MRDIRARVYRMRKRNLKLLRNGAAAAVLLAMTIPNVHSDEGMWLYNNPPRQQLKEKHGFDLTDAWLEHLQKSSVRFNSGGSGSFTFSTTTSTACLISGATVTDSSCRDSICSMRQARNREPAALFAL